MDKLLISDWISLVTAAGVLVALISNVIALREKGHNRAGEDAEMRSDIKHIKDQVDKLDDLPERIVKVEESTKQAHKRIDRIEDQRKGE